MSPYERILFPLVSRIEAERAHERTVRALACAQRLPAGRRLLRGLAGRGVRRPVRVFGLDFPNELGVAAGYDKNGLAPLGLALLGFGHIEVGTVTPWAQAGNHRPRVFRLKEARALINRMGFPNEGMARVAARLRRLTASREWAESGAVLGVSLGKQKETPLEEAARDYALVMRAFYPYADYLVLNVSSPNTPGLRQLQGRTYLEQLLGEVQRENRRLAQGGGPRPLLVKIAPDLSWGEIDQIVMSAEAAGVAGIIATNTTLERPGLSNAQRKEAGGLSGAPLGARSLEVVRYLCAQLGERMPVVAVGGVMHADDAQARLDVGAKLVQIYTGLVYGGPRLPGRILRSLEER